MLLKGSKTVATLLVLALCVLSAMAEDVKMSGAKSETIYLEKAQINATVSFGNPDQYKRGKIFDLYFGDCKITVEAWKTLKGIAFTFDGGSFVYDLKTIKVKDSKVEVCGTNPENTKESIPKSVKCSFPPVFKEESGLFAIFVSMSGDVPQDFTLTIPGAITKDSGFLTLPVIIICSVVAIPLVLSSIGASIGVGCFFYKRSRANHDIKTAILADEKTALTHKSKESTSKPLDKDVEALIDVSKTDKARTVNKLDESVQLAGNKKLQVKPTVEKVNEQQKAKGDEVIGKMFEEEKKRCNKDYEKIRKKAEEVRQIAEARAEHENIHGEYQEMLEMKQYLDEKEAKIHRKEGKMMEALQKDSKITSQEITGASSH